MSEKAELIRKMLEMQKKFIAHEHEHGLDPREYWAPNSGEDLEGYREEYMSTAMKVVELAHQEVGSQP